MPVSYSFHPKVPKEGIVRKIAAGCTGNHQYIMQIQKCRHFCINAFIFRSIIHRAKNSRAASDFSAFISHVSNLLPSSSCSSLFLQEFPLQSWEFCSFTQSLSLSPTHAGLGLPLQGRGIAITFLANIA